MIGVGLERGDQAGADGHADCRHVHPGYVAPGTADVATGNDGRNDQGQDHGDGVDAGFDCGGTFDGLEPESDTVEHSDHRATNESRKEGACSDTTLFGDARRNGRIFLSPKLDSDESNEGESANDEERNDASAAPWIRDATPLKSEENTDHRRKEDEGSERIEANDLT